MKLFARSNGKEFEIDLEAERDRVRLVIGRRAYEATLDDLEASVRTAFIGSKRLEFGWERRGREYVILIEGVEYRVLLRDGKTALTERAAPARAAREAAVEVRAPIPGLITRVLVARGAHVRKNQAVLTLDAMKLENEIGSPRDGVVRSVGVRPGQAVEKGQVLFVVG